MFELHDAVVHERRDVDRLRYVSKVLAIPVARDDGIQRPRARRRCRPDSDITRRGSTTTTRASLAPCSKGARTGWRAHRGPRALGPGSVAAERERRVRAALERAGPARGHGAAHAAPNVPPEGGAGGGGREARRRARAPTTKGGPDRDHGLGRAAPAWTRARLRPPVSRKHLVGRVLGAEQSPARRSARGEPCLCVQTQSPGNAEGRGPRAAPAPGSVARQHAVAQNSRLDLHATPKLLAASEALCRGIWVLSEVGLRSGARGPRLAIPKDLGRPVRIASGQFRQPYRGKLERTNVFDIRLRPLALPGFKQHRFWEVARLPARAVPKRQLGSAPDPRGLRSTRSSRGHRSAARVPAAALAGLAGARELPPP